MEPVQIQTEGQNKRKGGELGIVILLLVSLSASFLAGWWLKSMIEGGLNNGNLPATTPIPSTEAPVEETEQSGTKFVAGLKYFEDGFYMQVRDENQTTLVASIGRYEQQDGSYLQQDRVSLISTKQATRKINSTKTRSSAIVSDKFIRSWTTKYDESRVLKETSQMHLVFDTYDFQIETGILANDMAIRSLPGYTKFFSPGNAEVTLSGKTYEGKIVYYRTYSQNQSDLLVYANHLGITTDLLVFWDERGRTYVMDTTEVDKPVEIYHPHKIAFMSDGTGRLWRTFEVGVTRDSVQLPGNYVISMGEPISAVFKVARGEFVNKMPDGSYQWYLGSATGSVNIDGVETSGRGIVEYIHD